MANEKPKAVQAAASTPAGASPSSTGTASAAPSKFDPANVKVLKVLTVPLIKLRAGMTVFVKITAAMFVAKEMKQKANDDPNKQPPTLVHVIDLETGALAQIILGSVLKDIFNDEYPNDGYVGKAYKIVVGEQKASQGGGGKRYNQYEVYQIEA